MAERYVITLGRECGAGATYIAQHLSKELGIPYYDKDIFRMVSDKSGVLEEFFHVNSERPGNNLLYKLVKDLKPADQKPSLGKDIVSPDCILTDVGSVKTDIHLAASEMGLDGRFIGGHPMTGSEKSGFAHAQAHLFENAYYIITPSKDTAQEKIDWYRQTVQQFGALPVILNYREHDYATAAISHLPHLIAAALVNTVHDLDSREEMMKMLAAGGFKDITRIASSSPEMWEQICIENHDNISRVMDTFVALLEESRQEMNAGTSAAINQMFARSRNYRDSFSSRSLGSIKKTYRVFCDIIDESGAIATIATTLAVNGISIKNIGIVHSREFEEGVLQIEFYEEEPSLRAADILRQHRYQVWVR